MLTFGSLSARRAWIEMAMTSQISVSTVVALRKESVDRNASKIRVVAPDISSLSARRAWIEIAPRWRVPGGSLRRSPQGERG